MLFLSILLRFESFSWDLSPLEAQFWLPSHLINIFPKPSSSNPCANVDTGITIEGEYGRLNNYLIELVHMLELAVLSDPPKALVLAPHYYEMTHNHVSLSNVSMNFACVINWNDRLASNLTIVNVDAKKIYKQRETPFSSFRGQILTHLFLKASKEIRDRVEKFEFENKLSNGFNAIHYRGLEGHCLPEMARRRSSFKYYPALGRNLTANDVCDMNFTYVQSKMIQGGTSHLPLLIAHDGQNPGRLAELKGHFHAVDRTGNSPEDVLVDTLLLIRAKTFIPTIVSTLSQNVLHIRRTLDPPSLYDL